MSKRNNRVTRSSAQWEKYFKATYYIRESYQNMRKTENSVKSVKINKISKTLSVKDK